MRQLFALYLAIRKTEPKAIYPIDHLIGQILKQHDADHSTFVKYQKTFETLSKEP